LSNNLWVTDDGSVLKKQWNQSIFFTIFFIFFIFSIPLISFFILILSYFYFILFD